MHAAKLLWKSVAIASVIAALITACDSGDDNQSPPQSKPPAQGELVAGELLTHHNHDDVYQYLASTGLFANLPVVYDVEAYKIIYKTLDTNGAVIDASGLLTVPAKATGALSPLLSFAHGTVLTDSEVPSNVYGPGSPAVVMATFGYVVAAPDYIGYAASGQVMHPYIQAAPSGNAVIDMLRASKAFLAAQGVATNQQVFLAGYSEGGYVTIAAQKIMQESFAMEFPVTAASAGAGPYDVSGTVAAILQQPLISKPSTVGFVMKAYDTVYGLNRIAVMFQAPYVGIINTSYDGTTSGEDIDNQLPRVTAELFNPQFLADYAGTGETQLKALFAANNVYDWAPAAPTRLFHGENDLDVPYFNSFTAVEAMKAKGAPDVELVTCQVPPAEHYTCALPYIVYTVNFFAQYARDL